MIQRAVLKMTQSNRKIRLSLPSMEEILSTPESLAQQAEGRALYITPLDTSKYDDDAIRKMRDRPPRLPYDPACSA